jgi:hypothetical protein
MENIKISGAIALNILENKELNKKVYIFYDNHSINKYCDTSNNLFISDFFDLLLDNNFLKNFILVLEEPFLDDTSRLQILWQQTQHLTEFRNFFVKIINKCSKQKICNAFPIDIRLNLYPISFDIILDKITSNTPLDNNYFLIDYFGYLLHLFNIIINPNTCNDNKIRKFIKIIFDTCAKVNNLYYLKLKKQIIFFYNKFIKNNLYITISEFIKTKINNTDILFTYYFPFEYNHESASFIDFLDKINCAILEFYSYIIITKLNFFNNVYYAGYYHAQNLSFILLKYFNFKSIHHINANLDPSDLSQSCVIVNKKYFF